jgi:hypothetical protein
MPRDHGLGADDAKARPLHLDHVRESQTRSIRSVRVNRGRHRALTFQNAELMPEGKVRKGQGPGVGDGRDERSHRVVEDGEHGQKSYQCWSEKHHDFTADGFFSSHRWSVTRNRSRVFEHAPVE